MPARSGLSARDFAMFAGGASVGAIAGHLLPPLLAQAGALRGERGNWFELLRADHRRFLDLLTAMKQSGGRGAVYRTQLLLRLKRGLAAHAMAEEDVVYPLLSEEVGANGAAQALYADHGAVKTHLYYLERTMADERAWLARANELRKLVEGHAQEEEGTYFPRLRQAMDADAARLVDRHVRREKAMLV